MALLKVKNIGPIRSGLNENDGFVEFSGVTVLIGDQGTGKSTIAKIFSTLSWLEKALVRGDFSGDYVSRYRRFKKHLGYQNIINYLNKDSFIEYHGDTIKIVYQNERLKVTKLQEAEDYLFPKIMYVPAERNFVSSVDKPDLVKRLPLTIYTFLDEYEDAKEALADEVHLPIEGSRFEYKKNNKKSWLVGDDFKVNLLEASSGFQSLVPLFLVTRHLSELIQKKESTSHREISVNDEKEIRKEIERILKSGKLSEDVKRVLLEKLSARFTYSRFINIVEEPEQNLYPTSQKHVLYELLNYKNQVTANQLVLTTHSPYIVNYLTLAIKAAEVKHKISNCDNERQDDLFVKLSKIVPLKSSVEHNEVNIYQLSPDGTIKKLPEYHNLPTDENLLNQLLASSNDAFIELLKIEDQCQ